MDTLLQRVLNILIAPPGNLIFHLVLAFSVLSCLQAAWISRRNDQNGPNYNGRMFLGLVMLLAGQLVLFLSSGLAWQGIINPHILLPPLDRAITVFSLIWIVWLWAFPKPARLGDLVTGFLNLGVLILFLFTYSSWSLQGAESPFNNFWTDLVWELAGLIIVLTGMAILLFSRPPGWGFGLGMLGLSFTGLLAHLLLAQNSGDFSGYLRLSQLAAYPLLPTLLHRLTFSGPATSQRVAAALVESPNQVNFPQQERRRFSSDARTVHAFLELREINDPQRVPHAIAKVIAHAMLADMCFIVTGPEFGQVVLQAGYDLVREDEINGTMLEQNQIPIVAGALVRGKSLKVISSDSQPSDLQVIGNALGLKDPGTLLLIPLMMNESPWGALLLLSPYSKRQWTVEDQNFLASETERIALILRAAQRQMQEQLGGDSPDEKLKRLQASLERVQQENTQLAQSLDAARRDLEAARSSSAPAASNEEFDALVALQKEAQETISHLQTENERMQAILADRGLSTVSAAEAARMEADLRATLQEVALLQNELAMVNAQLLMIERQPGQVITGQKPVEDREVLTALAQDLRQPMASIVGYTDLLLAESVGILGALQRKFLERVRAAAERMRSMLDDLIQVAATGNGSLNLMPRPVDLGSVIDGAMLDTSAQLREKNITLRVDLPREMAPINADRDALQQIVVHLLQNAGAVTPLEGTVTLRARLQEDSGETYLLLQVIDTGGGVHPDNLSKVFVPRFNAESPLIQGLGDTGVGLTIAKTLVEAHGGRIWVESEYGSTTAFSILLPLRSTTFENAV